jgi:hypothetical protein
MPARYVARGPFSTEFIAKCREVPLIGLVGPPNVPFANA